jgi:hypothetical protein
MQKTEKESIYAGKLRTRIYKEKITGNLLQGRKKITSRKNL